MTPLEYYQKQLQAGLIQEDPQQFEVIGMLQQIYQQLLAEEESLLNRMPRVLKSLIKPKTIKGLYLWGSVGVGKTFVMDTFYVCCRVKKIRLHFHVFLQRIHEELRNMQGQINPLVRIASKLRKEVKLICFDEFFVSNIADAMILGELFQALFAEGICLVTTSNVPPGELYKNGIQRERFLPAIAAIKANTSTYHMISHHDYRLTHFQQAGVYFFPLDSQSESYLEKAFLHLAGGEAISEKPLELLGRTILVCKRTAHMIWFEFDVICGVGRSQQDYIELTKQYDTIFVSHIPVLQSHQLNLTTAFINLVDVFYDAQVRLVISAETDIEHIYPEGGLRFEFARTQSRLIEMQSMDYFNSRKRQGA